MNSVGGGVWCETPPPPPPEEFVRLLREGSWFDHDCTDEEFMNNFAGRYKELHGVTVSTDTPEHFMADLRKYGYIRP